MADRHAAAQFTALYRENYERVLRFVSRRIGVGGDAEDVTAEVFRVAWVRTSQDTPVSPAWLFVTARNMLRNHTRSTTRARPAQEAMAGEWAVAATAAGTDAADEVRRALERLRATDRDLLVLRYWDGLSTQEVSEVLV